MNRTLQRLLIFFFLLSAASYSYVWYSDKTYTAKQIALMFEPITSKYGIKIVYNVNDNFLSPLTNPGIPAGPSRNCKIKPIQHRILARYPKRLQKAFENYPIKIIKNYLKAIYFAKDIDQNGFRYSGSVNPYEKIVYLVDDGHKNDKEAVRTFHHEFSSLLLDRHGFLLNPWIKQNPNNFQYFIKTYKSWDEFKTTGEGTQAEYEKGFVSDYGQVSFENDFNEYAAMIFTYPEKFKKIMNQYPRVRAKFLIWLEFYHKIDPIFTEEYLGLAQK